MGKVIIKKVLGLLVEGINELGIGAFSPEIADYVEEDGCEA
jgi:hypothetical protein